MKTLKKTLTAMAAALFTLCFTFSTVHADLIYMPVLKEGSYTDRVEYSYVSRSYKIRTGSEDSTVLLYETPVDKETTGTLDDGFTFSSNTTYKDDNGLIWVWYEDAASSKTQKGWVCGKDLVRLFDSELFREQYKDEIITSSAAEKLDLSTLKTLVFYEYPTGKERWHVDVSGSDEVLYFDEFFTDPSGERWGYLTYYQGTKDSWVCLSHPELQYDELHALSDQMVLETCEVEYLEAGDPAPDDSNDLGEPEPFAIGAEYEEDTAAEDGAASEADTDSDKVNASDDNAEVPEETKPDKVISVQDGAEAEPVVTIGAKKSPIPAIAASVGGVFVVTAAVLLFLKKKNR